MQNLGISKEYMKFGKLKSEDLKETFMKE